MLHSRRQSQPRSMEALQLERLSSSDESALSPVASFYTTPFHALLPFDSGGFPSGRGMSHYLRMARWTMRCLWIYMHLSLLGLPASKQQTSLVVPSGGGHRDPGSWDVRILNQIRHPKLYITFFHQSYIATDQQLGAVRSIIITYSHSA